MKRNGFTGTAIAVLLLTAAGDSLARVQSPEGRGFASAADTVEVDLQAAIRIALSESPNVQVADKEITKKEYYRQEQNAALLPNLSLGANYNRAIQKQVMAMGMDGQTMKIEVGTDNTWGAGLNLAMPLVAPALWKMVQLSEIDIELAYESSRASKIATVAGVKSAYYGFLMAQDSYEVLLDSWKNAEFSAKIATDMFNNGLVSEYDKLRADVALKNIKPTLVSAENGVKLAIMQLKVLMGVDIDEKIKFAGRLSDYRDQMENDRTVFEQESELDGNSDLRRIDIQTRQIEKARQLSKASYLPTLALTGAYQWSSLNNDFRIGHYLWNPYAVVGLSLNVPIFEGRVKWIKDKQNKLSIDQLEISRKDVFRGIELQVQNSLNNIEKAIEQVGSNQESVMEAEKAFSISQRRYEVGSGTLLELNDSELALTRARLQYNQSIYDYLAEKANLEKTLGSSDYVN